MTLCFFSAAKTSGVHQLAWRNSKTFLCAGFSCARIVFRRSGGEFKIRRQLKQETAHLRAEHVGDLIKFFDQIFRALKAFVMCNGAIDFDRVTKMFRCLPLPGFNGCRFRPAIKRRVEFDGAELFSVMLKPAVRRQIVRVKRALPFAIKPAGRGDVNLHGRIYVSLRKKRDVKTP